ncbi:hypothetical protein GGI20_004198 [Coemansia sp. BCRC 34301]|nr:hypothetical protein GGI20_004198 [Coemansia sp. BCRC 34301]
MSSDDGKGKGMERPTDENTGPYLTRPLAIGLNLSTKDQNTQTVRRQSLTQRLGFGAPNDDSARSVSPTEGATLSVRAESVDISGGDMYVGTSHGHIMHYTVAPLNLGNTESAESVCVANVDLKVGAKRVDHVLSFSQLNRLVVLCGSTAMVLSLPDLRPITTMKGATCISYDERVQRSTASTVILCVARMRSIQMYRLGADLRLELEVPITCTVASISQYGRFLCVADTQAYRILDLAKHRSGSDSSQLELFPTQQPRTDPESGHVIRPPRPRTLVVGPNEFLFLTSSEDDNGGALGVIVTSSGEAQRGTLQFSAYPRGLVYDAPFLIATSAGSVDVYDTSKPEPALVQRFFEGESVGCRLCIAAGIMVGSQLARFGEEPVEDHALSAGAVACAVAVAHDSVRVLAREPPLLRVDRMLRANRVADAMAIVDSALASGVSPESSEARYCVLMAGLRSLAGLLLDDALLMFRRGRMDPRALIHVFSEYEAFLGPLLPPLSLIPLPDALRSAVRDLGSVDQIVELAVAGNDEGDRSALADALKASAAEMLERFLEHCRSSGDFMDSSVPVDTLLARLYVASDQHAKFVDLLNGSHMDLGLVSGFCHNAQHRYYESLVEKARGDPRAVLDIWRTLLTAECTDKRFGGMSEYTAYVETQDQDTVLAEYLWISGIDAEASQRVLAFLDDASVAALDADSAMTALQKQKSGDHAQRLLIERLITVSHPRASHYLTHLLTAYVRDLSSTTSCADLETRFHCAQAADLRLTFRAWINRESSGCLRARLIALLGNKRPVAYDAEAVLCCIENAGCALHTERALLLAALDRTSEAARVLVSEAHDYAEAEMLLSHVDGGIRILLRLYLTLDDDEMAARLVADLLSRYTEGDLDDLLAEMPGHWPYSVAEPLVSRQLTRLAHSENALRIECGLRQSLASAEQLRAIDVCHDSGPIVLDYSQACAKCHKLLGSSAFVLEPEREIRHVSCG